MVFKRSNWSLELGDGYIGVHYTILFKRFFFLLKYSWFVALHWFLLCSRVAELYMYIYSFLYSFPLLFFTEYRVWLLGLHNGALLFILVSLYYSVYLYTFEFFHDKSAFLKKASCERCTMWYHLYQAWKHKQKNRLFIDLYFCGKCLKKNKHMEIITADLTLVVTIGWQEKKDSKAFIIFCVFTGASQVVQW